MSSARIAPTPRSPSRRSQPWPRSWNGKSGWVIAAGVGSARKRRSPAWSRDESDSSSETSPSSTPASSVSSPETARTSSTMPTPARRRSRKRSAFSTSERRTACQRSPMRTNGSFAAARSASSSSVSSVSPTARRQSNCASSSDESSPLDATRRRARRRQVDPDARRRAQPRRGQQHRDVALLEPRHRLAEEEPHLLLAELGLGRLGVVELDPDARRAPARARAAAGSGHGADRRRAGTRKRRRRGPRAATRAGRAWDRRSACSHSSSTSARLVPRPMRALVEVEAEPPATSAASWSRARVDPPESLRSSAPSPEWRGSAESGAVRPVEHGRWRSRGRPSTAPAARCRRARRSRAIWSTSTG